MQTYERTTICTSWVRFKVNLRALVWLHFSLLVALPPAHGMQQFTELFPIGKTCSPITDGKCLLLDENALSILAGLFAEPISHR